MEGSRAADHEAADRRDLAPGNAKPWVRDVLTVFLGLFSPAGRGPSDSTWEAPRHRGPEARGGGQAPAPNLDVIHVVDEKAMPWI